MTYAVPEIVLVRVLGLRALTRVAFRGLGEPILGAMAPDDAVRRLAAVGFAAIADTDARDWARTAPGSAALALPFRGERLIVARRR